MTVLHETSQSLSPGDVVELFQLDLSPLGINEIWPFTKSNIDGQKRITFQNIEYVPVDVQSKGWIATAKGQFPRPKIVISNTMGFLAGLIFEHNDGVGAKLTRLRTFRQFLDGEAEADPTMHYEPEIYYVDRKVRHNKQVIEFELASAMDQEGVKLPRRTLLRDTCTHQYRIWNGSAFDYSKATCPYSAANYFAEDGTPVYDPENDKCGLRLSDCKKRFGNQPLPTRAFPGLLRRSV